MKQVSDLTFPNVKLLREECLRRIYDAPLEQVSRAEWDGIRNIMVSYVKEAADIRGMKNPDDWMHDPCLNVIGQDFRECAIPMPKWAAMAAWLNSDGIVKYHPTLVCRIVSAALQGNL